MVDVNTQNKTISVNVSSSGVSSNVNASGDTTLYYSNKAREWAISNRIVDNVDYSSKYYANRSKSSSEQAKNYSETALNTLLDFQEQSNTAIEELNQLKTTGKDEINLTVAEGKTEINSTKTTILQDIEFVADGEKKEIEDLIDNGKEELKESIDGIKVLTTLEIGDIGFTQMAIDETKGKRRVLNGQLIIQDQYVQFTNIIKNSVTLNPSLACTEAEWQTAVTMSTNGVCEKFVIDDNAGTIRLPKYPQYLDLTNNASAKMQTVSIKGNGMTLGLTNGGGNFGLDRFLNNSSLLGNPNAYGKATGSSVTDAGIQSKTTIGVTTDATKSGITGSVTVPAVTSEKIAGTYFIQVATGSETEDNIINEIELNNPFSLLDYKYSEYELNNASWLRSQGQFNSKAIYPAVYDLLLKIYNGTETKAGVSVKLSTEEYTDYDFVLNTAEETFRLPIKVKANYFENIAPVVGNEKVLGLTNGSSTYGLGLRQQDWGGAKGSTISGVTAGEAISTTSAPNNSSITGYVGITTDPTKSGIEAHLTENTDLYLYFYVGETVQNANLINAGRIEEKLADKVDTNASNFTADGKSLISGLGMPSSKYIDLTLGASGTSYTAPANGWFTIAKRTNSAGQIVEIRNHSSGNITFRSEESISGRLAITSCPASKTNSIVVTYTAGGDLSWFKFIYAEGDK